MIKKLLFLMLLFTVASSMQAQEVNSIEALRGEWKIVRVEQKEVSQKTKKTLLERSVENEDSIKTIKQYYPVRLIFNNDLITEMSRNGMQSIKRFNTQNGFLFLYQQEGGQPAGMYEYQLKKETILVLKITAIHYTSQNELANGTLICYYKKRN